MRGPAALALLLVTSCGPSEERGPNTAELNRIGIQRNEMEDIGRTARLQPLGALAVPADYRGQVCRFAQGTETIVVTFGGAAVARIDRTARTFRAQAPIGPLGGFWRDNELALSIGVEPGQPARARVTNRVTEARTDVEGTWSCGTPAP